MGSPRRTLPLAHVLSALFAEPRKAHYGLEIARAAGLSSGTTYPILARLEREGWVASYWEDIDPVVEGRRPRRYYRLTGAGEHAASEILEEVGEIANRQRASGSRGSPELGTA